MQDASCSHPSDQQLLSLLDCELAGAEARLLRRHLASCHKCQLRSREFETAAADYTQAQSRSADRDRMAAARARAALQNRLAELQPPRLLLLRSRPRLIYAAAVCGLLILLYCMRPERRQQPSFIVSMPDAKLTPGAARLVDRQAVCTQGNVKNKAVSADVRRRVFEEYHIPGADPQGYEIDYLITPALGGADDLQNLWPHSYIATAWNARVKDELEDRLRDIVCDGTLDLKAAQQAIAGNWIAAYKHYFHTEKPLHHYVSASILASIPRK